MSFTALIQRGAWTLIVLLGVLTISFTLSLVIPSDPARIIAGPKADAESLARIRAELGLDRPLWQQYVQYVGDLISFDLGTSNVSGEPVLDEILARAPASIELMGSALLLSLVIGIPLGISAAIKRS